MDAATDRIPALHLTLEHELPVAGGDWVRVTGLTLDGSDVVVDIGGGASIRVPGTHLVAARRSGELADPIVELDVEGQLCGWYGGDLPGAEHALEVRRGGASASSPRVAYGHPVPELVRATELVGIFGGDLDALLDALGEPSDADSRARLLRVAAEHDHLTDRGAREDGSPPEPVADDELAETLAAHYGGDLEAVTQ